MIDVGPKAPLFVNALLFVGLVALAGYALSTAPSTAAFWIELPLLLAAVGFGFYGLFRRKRRR